jgi:hypothetical protein
MGPDFFAENEFTVAAQWRNLTAFTINTLFKLPTLCNGLSKYCQAKLFPGKI